MDYSPTMDDKDPRPWWERHPLTVPRGHTLADGTVILFEATTACPCASCLAAIREVYGDDWPQTARPEGDG